MQMANRPQGNDANDGGGANTGLFPLFPALSNAISGATSAPPQWLCNASFAADLSVINAASSSVAPNLSEPEAEEDAEEGISVEKKHESLQPRSYELVEEEEEERVEEGSSRDSDGRKSERKRNKKKKKRRKRRLSTDGDGTSDVSRSRKLSVRDSDEYYLKPAKDYYLDARPDPDNLAYGSLYRMDVPRYRLFNPDKVPGLDSQRIYLRNGNGSILDRENDVDAVEGRAKSDGRYWSAKHAALERHKSFKRIRFVTPKKTLVLSPDHFIPLLDTQKSQESENGNLSSINGMIEASWEDEVLDKTREFNKLTREHPHDEKAWLAFADFQDKVSGMQTQKGVRLQTLEKKISILEKASELNPGNEELLLSLLKAYQSRDSADVLMSRWEKALMQHSTSYRLWREFLHVVQGEFSRFKVSEVRKMYSHAIRALSSASSKRLRQVDITSEPSDPAIIQQELALVDMFVSLCRFEWQAGYQELGTALFQAEIEFSIFPPSLLLTEQSKRRLFEHFWSSNGARVGEDGALGWSSWLQKEEENRQRILREEHSDNDDVGGWTGWTKPLSAQKGGSVTQMDIDGGDVAPDGFDEEMDNGNSKPEDDTEAMLKLLGIDIDGGASDEVKDTSTWAKWSEEEVSRDHNEWMPIRKAGETSIIDKTTGREVDEQFSSIILYEDLAEYLFSISSTEARLSLVYQFIDFFGGHISPWTSSNSMWWREKMNSLETLASSTLENVGRTFEGLMALDGAHGCDFVDLLGGGNDMSMRIEMMKFLRNAVLLCLTAFPRNYILEEAVLVAEELFATNMRTSISSATPCQALAKHLLKSDRQDLLLCGVYARREAASGNMTQARRVFDMALSSITRLPAELQSNAPLLYLWYAKSEMANANDSIQGEESSSRALHILCCLGSGPTYDPYTCRPSSTQMLRARQGFREKLKKIRFTWAHGIIDDQSAALVCSAAMFEELTNGFTGALEILEQVFHAVLPGRKSQSHQLEALFEYYVRILQRNHNQLSLLIPWSSISEGLLLYPVNPELYRALVGIWHHCTTSQRLRMMFDDYSRRKPSVVISLFALSYEMSKGGSRNRIRGLFERALAHETLSHSVVLWRCYMAYEMVIARDPSKARRIFFRAINACPWSKKLWLDGFTRLNSVLSAKEMSDLQEVMRDKELNLRTDIYEILLQDETVT